MRERKTAVSAQWLNDNAFIINTVASGKPIAAGGLPAAVAGIATEPITMTTGQLLTATFLLLPLSLVMDAPWTLAPSAAALGSLAAVAVVSTVLPAFLLFWLIQKVGATNSSLLAFFMPVVAVTLGTTLLGETLPWQAFAGLGLIMLGAAAVNGRISRPTKAEAQAR